MKFGISHKINDNKNRDMKTARKWLNKILNYFCGKNHCYGYPCLEKLSTEKCKHKANQPEKNLKNQDSIKIFLRISIMK